MKFGTFHLMEQPNWKDEAQVYREALEQIELADALGFDNVWLTEHHFSSKPYAPDVPGEYGICASPLLLGAHVAARTRRVRIGLAVKVLPLEHPLRTAEDAAMVDILSGGRLDFGAGYGYRKYEFDGLAVPIGEKHARMQEALDIIIKAWTQPTFSYDGRFYKIPTLSLLPRPLQKPHPPVWVASRLGTKEIIDYAVRNGYGLLSAWAPPEELRASYDLFARARAEAGKGEAPFDFPAIRHVYVEETDALARRRGEENVKYYLESTALFRPVGPHEQSEMIFGGPDTCIRKIQRLRDEARVNSILCWMNFGGMAQEQVLRSMRLFAEHVMPEFR